MESTQITMIEVSKISLSPLNTRTIRDQESIQELSVSIRSFGLLQPITIRSLKKGKFEVVAGERRLRAFTMLKEPRIPCLIKVLSDDEAMELNIIENLHREDLHPFDQAMAFHNLITNPLQYEAVAEKFGKSISFVKSRLRLIDLIPSFQELYKSDTISTSMALAICTLDIKAQLKVFDQFYTKTDTSYYESPSLKQINRFIDNSLTAKLADATFDRMHMLLVPSAGSCILCKSNSDSKFTLFSSDTDTGICSNVDCFNEKTAIAFQLKIKQLVENEPEIILGTDGYIRDKDRLIYEELIKEKFEIPTFNYQEGFSLISEPQKPELPNPAEFDLAEQDEDYLEELNHYQDELTDYDTDYIKYSEKISSQDAVRVFMVTGSDKGKFVHYTKHDSGSTKSSGSPAQDMNQHRIDQLKTKHKRNNELEFEKAYIAIQEYMGKSAYPTLGNQLTSLETSAFLFRIAPHYSAKELNLNSTKDFDDISISPIMIPDPKALHIFRLHLLSDLSTNIPVSEKQKANYLINISLLFFPSDTQAILDEKARLYLKRNQTIVDQILILQPELEVAQA